MYVVCPVFSFRRAALGELHGAGPSPRTRGMSAVAQSTLSIYSERPMPSRIRVINQFPRAEGAGAPKRILTAPDLS